MARDTRWCHENANHSGGVLEALLGMSDRLLRKGDYVWGSFVKPERVDGYIVGTNPGDRSDKLGRFAFSTESVHDAVNSARRGVRTWSRIPPRRRAAALQRFGVALMEAQDRLAVLLTRETGKPLWEARQEAAASIRALELMVEDGLGLLEPKVVNPRDARADWAPHGVVGVITPYQFPLLVPTMQCMTAILAGNSVVLKPSKFAPAIGQTLAELMDRAQLPRGVFNMVQGSGAGVGTELATHEGLDMLVMSCDYATARTVRRATASRPELPTVFNTGGKSTAIVVDRFDIERAIYDVLVGAFLTSGQRHDSTGRAIVLRDVFDEFCSALAGRAARVHVGYGFDSDVFMGPLVSDVHRNKARRFARDVVKSGNTSVLESSVVKTTRRGFYLSPSVHWVHWKKRQPLLETEPPGPTLLVYCADTWEEAVALHNRFAFRNTASVFADPDWPDLPYMLEALDTGSVHVNRATIGSSLRLPSAGRGRSSNHYPSGIDLLRFMTAPRSTLVDSRPFDPGRLVPGIDWDDTIAKPGAVTAP